MPSRLVLLIVTLCMVPLSGCLYSRITVPLDTDTAETTLGTKVGRASNESVLWLVAWGDAGTEAAARQGGITTIRHLDVEREMILFGVYSRQTTIAYGD